MKIKNGQERGITLIALVVTIVVLLILAGVSINAVFSDNGIIKRAQATQDKMSEAQQNDITAINSVENWINEYSPKEKVSFSLNGKKYEVEKGTTYKEFVEANVGEGKIFYRCPCEERSGSNSEGYYKSITATRIVYDCGQEIWIDLTGIQSEIDLSRQIKQDDIASSTEHGCPC